MKLIPKFLAVGLVATMATTAFAADHRDGDAVKLDPAADINDVYTYMNGNNVILAMTVSPFADATAKFSDATQYVFHVTSYDSFGGTKSKSTDVICKFTVAQVATCWVGTADYVTGDASNATTGLTSASGKVKVFAGPRADPFYFFLSDTTTTPPSGFNGARAFALGAITGYPGGPAAFIAQQMYASGCIKNTAGINAAVTPKLVAANQAQNNFAGKNVLAISFEIDKSLLIANPDEVIAVWASTNNG